jgi:hypothetical protein
MSEALPAVAVPTAAAVPEPTAPAAVSVSDSAPIPASGVSAEIQLEPVPQTTVEPEPEPAPAPELELAPAAPAKPPKIGSANDFAELAAAAAHNAGQKAESAPIAAEAMANGTALLLNAVEASDAELCTKYYKLVLEIEPDNLKAAKLLQLSFALFMEPGDADAAREVEGLRGEVARENAAAAAVSEEASTPR